MNQLTQQLKSGQMEILEVPFPALNKGQIMVRNYYSVISAGTEGKTVTDARKGYIAKAQSRQKEVKQVIEMIKTNGLLSTYKLVMNKLEAPSSLGYSCAGEVIAIGADVTQFVVGDLVACGGATACHADVVAVPVNLAVKINPQTDLKQAAFATIAAIAIQGIRQADIQMGSNCVIIGMGLIGQLTYKILEASGIYPLGIDVSNSQIELCKKADISNIYNRNQEGIEDIVLRHTNGLGTDAVIITAASSSLDPVEFAGIVARRKAKVVIVGAVPTGFSRVHYYKKELDIRMSSSYGPGRYDVNYEEKGIDYPVGYVRWTENRNMNSFADLLNSGKLQIDKLITHIFEIENAPAAYDMILSKQEAFSGILIKYDEKASLSRDVILQNKTYPTGDANVGFIGAGSFAQNFLLPNMKGNCNFIGISTGHGNTARYVGNKYGFNYCAESTEKVLNDDLINTVFIVTRHNLHYEYVMKCINHNKNIFVEKPLAMNEEELNEIKTLFETKNDIKLMVGFNRRFAPSVVELKKNFVKEQPKSIVIRINSGVMPLEHWTNDPEIGGGRIIGEACHFVDLAMFLADSPIVSVCTEAMNDPNNLNNTVVVNLKMKNGSIASLCYFANGNKKVPKEYIEVYCGGTVATINDYCELHVLGNKTKKFKYKQNKGHAAGVQSFLSSVKNGTPCPIPFEESYLSMLATFKINKSILENRKIML